MSIPINHKPILAVVAAFVAAVCVLTMQPASAQRVVVHDPKADADSYDIDRLVVNHRKERVRIIVEADRTPYWYDLFVDTPGGKPWKYVVRWSAYWPHRVIVWNRQQFKSGEGAVCRLFSARELHHRDVTLKVPVKCLKGAQRLRVKAKSWDDESGWQDRTRWTRWAKRG